MNEKVDIKIGDFVQQHLDKITKFLEQNPNELNELQTLEYSKKVFETIPYPFIKKLDEIEEADINTKYWQDIYIINNIQYRFCSQLGGSHIYANGLTRSQRDGNSFLQYLKEKNLLLEQYRNKDIVFIVGSNNTQKESIIINISSKSSTTNIKNIILYGVAGVGKTHNTNKLIRLIEDGKSDREVFETIKTNELNDSIDISDIKERVKFITFHQSFGYEDFIEGFRPILNEEGKIGLEKGIFQKICKDADKDRDNIYYLVIDEINRGNISKIFGELITLIEEDKRDKLEITLPYSKKPFKIPSNLYIIGTMNSTDKSIALIDIALRRRFTFLKMKPNENLITYTKAQNIFKALNEYIAKNLGEDYQIGHSYFMNIESDDDLKFILDYKIEPLLEEYFYGDDRLKEVLKIIKSDEKD